MDARLRMTGTAARLVTNAISTQVQDTASLGGRGGTVVNGALERAGHPDLGERGALQGAAGAHGEGEDYLTLMGGTQGTYLNSVHCTISVILADNGIVSPGLAGAHRRQHLRAGAGGPGAEPRNCGQCKDSRPEFNGRGAARPRGTLRIGMPWQS